jgi:HEAT repeat protein
MHRPLFYRHPPSGRLALLLVGVCLSSLAPARALAASPSPGAANAGGEIIRLFSDEMQQATAKLKWRGERLTEDTVYAVALTGLSWELAWGNDHLFSLAWGDYRKVPTLSKRGGNSYSALVAEVQRYYADHDYRRAVSIAFANFSLDEIGCDVDLKEPVGYSLLTMGQPERAFPLFAAPFDPTRSLLNVAEADRKFREAALNAARRAGLTKEAIAFALSLLLEPGQDAPTLNETALRYLEEVGVDVERVLLGILQTPEHLRDLPAYQYAAADLLAYRASPRLLPFLLHLAQSDDVYLRSRAVIGLGIAAYQPRAADPMDWTEKAVLMPLREYGLSAAERKLIDKEIRDAAVSDKYRLRAAAGLALALTGTEENVPLLQKLARDRAYVLSTPEVSAGGHVRHLMFPVRMAAAVGLARFGIQADPGGGDLAGKALDTARRGGEDVTNDRRNLRREVASHIYVSPLDMAAAAPLTSARR